MTREPEQVPHPGEDLAGAGVGDALQRGGERLPLDQLGVRAGGLDELVLVGVEQGRGRRRVGLLRRAQGLGDLRDHRLDAVHQQLALGRRLAQLAGRAARVADVGDGLHGPVQRRAVPGGVGRALGHHAGDLRRVEVLEALGVVGEQTLADELQQDGVVALERRVHVHVGAQPGDPVLGEEPGPAARLAGDLERVQRVPRRRRLERRGERLEVLARLRGVVAAGEHVVERGEQVLVREPGGVRLREQREQAALVLGVVEDDDLVGGRRAVELAALVAVGDRDGQADAGGRDRGTVERDAALHERAEHREEAAAGARDGRRVRAVLVDVAVPVEQVGARDADLVEPEPAVVDAVQAALEPVVLTADARAGTPSCPRRGSGRRTRAPRGRCPR